MLIFPTLNSAVMNWIRSVCEGAGSDWQAWEMTSTLTPSSLKPKQLLTHGGVFNVNIRMRALNWLLMSWFGDVNLCQKAFPHNFISILKAFLFNSATQPIHFLWMPKRHRKIALSALVAFMFDLLSNAVKLMQDDYFDKATSKDRFKTRTLWLSPLMSNKQYSVRHGWYTSKFFFLFQISLHFWVLLGLCRKHFKVQAFKNIFFKGSSWKLWLTLESGSKKMEEQ